VLRDTTSRGLCVRVWPPHTQASERRGGGEVAFGLWSVCFPPVLIRTARRLPVEALRRGGVWVTVTGYPRNGAPGP
jgi:hypothetical protein